MLLLFASDIQKGGDDDAFLMTDHFVLTLCLRLTGCW